MTKIKFDKECPKEIVDSFKDALTKCEVFLPSWCEEVCVCFNPNPQSENEENSSVCAYVSTQYAYRRTTLYLCPSILTCDEQSKLEILKHEFCHILNCPMTEYVDTMFEHLTDNLDDKATRIIQEEFVKHREAITQDLMYLIKRIESKNG